jgi:glycosyltransferase involved in cell wall biosynthesis
MPKKMKILYFLNGFWIQVEGISKEVTILSEKVESIIYNPYSQDLIQIKNKLIQHHNLLFPLRVIPFILEKKYRQDINHFYKHFFDPNDQKYVKHLRKPIIYTITGYINETKAENIKKYKSLLKKIDAIVVGSHEDKDTLESLGLNNVQVIFPGTDLKGFNYSKPENENFKLLFASAPLRMHSFEHNGVNLITNAFTDLKNIELVCLWRGKYLMEMEELIKKTNNQKKIHIINKVMNMKEELNKVHATILPYTGTDECKTCPNSLVESLAAGKPVLTTDIIPFSNLVLKEKCGVVIKPTKEAFIEGIRDLRENYEKYQEKCIPAAKKYFSKERFVKEYNTIYSKVVLNNRELIT